MSSSAQHQTGGVVGCSIIVSVNATLAMKPLVSINVKMLIEKLYETLCKLRILDALFLKINFRLDANSQKDNENII